VDGKKKVLEGIFPPRICQIAAQSGKEERCGGSDALHHLYSQDFTGLDAGSKSQRHLLLDPLASSDRHGLPGKAP